MAERATKGELRVVLASLVIPEGAKLVWLQDWLLDPGGHGCWLTNGQMGERLGMPERTVERHRLDLASHGLHERIPPGRTVARGWCSTVPAECRFKGTNPDTDTIVRKRVILDDGLGRWRPPAEFPATSRPVAGSNKERDEAGRGEVVAKPRSSSAFDSPDSLASLASQTPKAEEVREAESTPEADELPAPRPQDLRPADDVTADGFADIAERRRRWRTGAA